MPRRDRLIAAKKREYDKLAGRLTRRCPKWRELVDTGDLSGLDPATIVLILKLITLLIQLWPIIFGEDVDE